MSDSLSDAAVQLAQQGYRVFPLHGIVSGKCTCRKANCTSPGKHPRIKQWQSEASSDPGVIAAFWKQWPDANIGLATGKASGVFVLDIDGSAGEAALKVLEERHGSLPPTLTAATGRGRHLYFEVPRA